MRRLNVIDHCCWRDIMTAGHESWLNFCIRLLQLDQTLQNTPRKCTRLPCTSKKHKPMRLVKLCGKFLFQKLETSIQKLPSARVHESYAGKCRSRPTCASEIPKPMLDYIPPIHCRGPFFCRFRHAVRRV